jgi:peptide/nickel transport system substrate-binding protein
MSASIARTLPLLRARPAVLLCALMAASALSLALASPAHAARGDLKIGMSIEPAGLDPTIAAPVAIGQVTWQNIFEGLVRLTEKGEIKPQLAKSWTISPDGLTYSFTLQPGVTFSNGEAFSSETAKFTLDRARGDSSVNPQKRFFAAIDSIETPDATTLVLHLKEPAGNLLYHLTWPAAVMVEPKSADTDKTDPVGTGPFILKSWTKGDRLELTARKDYWDKDKKVALSDITFRFINDPQAQVAALKGGDVDAFPELGAPELFDGFKDDKKFIAYAGNTELKVVAGMNNTRPPFNDKRVRQALMMAVDRSTLIEGAWSGLGTPIGSHYTPNDPGYVDETGKLAYDPEKAKALLKEAGYGNGLTFSIKAPQMSYATRTSEVLQAMLTDVGVTMNIVPTEFPAKWLPEVFKGHDFDMTIVAHAEPMDIDIYSRPDYYFGYKNPAFNDTIATAEKTTDDTKRAELYGAAQAMLAEDVPALYLYVLPKLGIWDARLEGLWKDEPIPSNDLTEVHWKE